MLNPADKAEENKVKAIIIGVSVALLTVVGFPYFSVQTEEKKLPVQQHQPTSNGLVNGGTSF